MSSFTIKVWGDYACFTRPEMKVERVSYDVITPSAARGIFEALFWKPEFSWQIESIAVLKPIQWMNIRRNEVTDGVALTKVQIAMHQGFGNLGLDIQVKKHRAQRASLILKDVAYRVEARLKIHPNAIEHPGKYPAMFERRLRKGQVYHRPYLGCREFSAHVAWCDPDIPLEPTISDSRDLGWMLYDIDYSNPADVRPLFFQARMTEGLIRVPDRYSVEVRG